MISQMETLLRTEILEQVIEDSDEISVVQAATQLKNELDKAVSRPKESVIDQLKQISGQTVPSKCRTVLRNPKDKEDNLCHRKD